jgi:hypothetical protein
MPQIVVTPTPTGPDKNGAVMLRERIAAANFESPPLQRAAHGATRLGGRRRGRGGTITTAERRRAGPRSPNSRRLPCRLTLRARHTTTPGRTRPTVRCPRCKPVVTPKIQTLVPSYCPRCLAWRRLAVELGGSSRGRSRAHRRGRWGRYSTLETNAVSRGKLTTFGKLRARLWRQIEPTGLRHPRPNASRLGVRPSCCRDNDGFREPGVPRIRRRPAAQRPASEASATAAATSSPLSAAAQPSGNTRTSSKPTRVSMPAAAASTSQVRSP